MVIGFLGTGNMGNRGEKPQINKNSGELTPEFYILFIVFFDLPWCISFCTLSAGHFFHLSRRYFAGWSGINNLISWMMFLWYIHGTACTE